MSIMHWLIPNKKNKFHPLILRPAGLLFILILAILIQPVYNISSAKQPQVLGYATDVNITDLNALTNQERANNGLPPLRLHSQLNNAAYAKATDMFSKNYWAHVSPDGTTPWHFISSAGYSYAGAGENLAKDFNFSSGVIAGWMGSATHRANVLSSAYQDVGYAVINGSLQGSDTTLVVAMYGEPSAPAPAATTAPTSTQPTPTPAQAAPAPTPTAVPLAPESPTETSDPPAPAALDTTNTDPVAEIPATVTPARPPKEPALATQPIKAYTNLNWGQKASLLLISTMALLFVLKHTLIWREQKRGLRNIWLRAHPLGQASVLTAAFIVTIVNGAGVIL